MSIRSMLPWASPRRTMTRGERGGDPFLSLKREMDRVFENFWDRFERPFGMEPTAGFPRTDISETEDEIEVAMELPGIDEKDIDVSVSEDVITVRGEKKDEREEEKKGYYLSERSYGSFHRTIPIPPGVDADKAEARFRKGVLTITLPKTDDAKSKTRRIEVKPG